MAEFDLPYKAVSNAEYEVNTQQVTFLKIFVLLTPVHWSFTFWWYDESFGDKFFLYGCLLLMQSVKDKLIQVARAIGQRIETTITLSRFQLWTSILTLSKALTSWFWFWLFAANAIFYKVCSWLLQRWTLCPSPIHPSKRKRP